MNSLANRFDEVTVILLKSKFNSDVPKIAQLRKLLGTPDVERHKDGGLYRSDIFMLLNAVEFSSKPIFPLTNQGISGIHFTDILLVKTGASRGTFLKIAHPELVVDGFNLTKQNLCDLDFLLKKIKIAKEVHFSYESWCRTVQQNMDKFLALEINDPSVIEFDVQTLEQHKSSYAVQTIANIHNEITQWVIDNRWI